MLGSWPLVGREQELAALSPVLDGGAAVLAGAAGVGRTRLAAEVAAAARSRGLSVEWATATRAARGIPFGALAPLLPVPSPGTGPAPADVLRAARRWVVRGRRLLLVVDDAHLLDDAGAVLVHQLAAGRAAAVLVTVRAGEPAPDPVVTLWKDVGAAYVPLGPLDRDRFDELLHRALGRVDGSCSYRLWHGSGGNALLVRELVRSGLETGALVRTDGIWRWTGSSAPSQRLQEVVVGRLGRLGPGQHVLLDLLALGEPLALRAVERFVDTGAVEDLERRGLVLVRTDGRRQVVSLAQHTYGDVIRGRMPSTRARALARRLADDLEGTGVRRREDVPRLARWRLDSGTTGDPALMIAAARQAVAASDHGLAARLAEAAQQAGGGVPAGLARAEALIGQARHGEAEVLLRHLLGVAASERERAVAGRMLATTLFWGLGRAAEAIALLERLLTQARDPRWRAELAADRALFTAFDGRPAAALEQLAPYLDGRPSPAEAELRVPAALARTALGQVVDAVHEADRGLAALAEQGRTGFPARIFLLTARCNAEAFTGRPDAAEATADAAHRAAVRGDTAGVAAHWLVQLGWLALRRGRVRTASDHLHEAVLLLRDHDFLGSLVRALSTLAEALALAGDVTAARAAAAEAADLSSPAQNLLHVWFAVAQARVEAADGATAAAVARCVDAADHAAAAGAVLFEAEACWEAVRLGEHGLADRLTGLAGRVQGALAPAQARAARALADDDGLRLDAAAAELAGLGSLLAAAEVAAVAARAHRTAGRSGAEAASRTVARALAARCEGAVTRPLRGLEDAPLPAPLTPREEEVAAMASAGLSDRDIALRLSVSIRTVSNHLHRVYGKLGVTRRSQLPAALRTGPLGPPA